MKDRLPLSHRVGFLETDSEMEISVQTVSLASAPGNNTYKRQREAEQGRGRSWAQQTPQVVLELGSPSGLSQTGHKVRFYNPLPTILTPFATGMT